MTGPLHRYHQMSVDQNLETPRSLGESTRSALRRALEARPARMLEVPDRRRAAVLLPLFERASEPWIVLTRRTETVRSHKGEISFPGGAEDPDDPDLWRTAVRETTEELGLEPHAMFPLGSLDECPTFSSNFVVSPFVAAINPPARWKPSAFEIAEVIELPLRELADIGRTEEWEFGGIRHPMPIFELNGHYVWGLTAHILGGFLNLVAPALGWDAHAPAAAARGVVRELAVREGFDWVGVYWVRDADLVLGPYAGAAPTGHERIRIPEGVCGSVATTGVTEVVPDARARPGHIACDLRIRSEVVAPIVVEGAVMGVLDVDSSVLDRFAHADVAAIEAAAARIGATM